MFQDIDKHVVALVEDADILTYQTSLRGFPYEVNSNVLFLQMFVRTDKDMYYIRKYDIWTKTQ